MINRIVVVLFLVLPVVVVAATVSANGEHKPGWTSKNLAQGVKDCRSNTRVEFRGFYLQENNFTEDNFPADREAEFEEWIEPIIGTCGCIIESVSKEVTFNEYASFSPYVVKRFNELIAIDGVCFSEQVAKKTPPSEPASNCVRFLPDPVAFPYASIGEARLTLEKRKFRGGETHDKEGITWAFYEKPEGGLDVDITYFGPASPFESAMVWRRPDLTVTPNLMLISTRCESTAERCAQFEKFLQEVESQKTMG